MEMEQYFKLKIKIKSKEIGQNFEKIFLNIYPKIKIRKPKTRCHNRMFKKLTEFFYLI